ncbi:MAG TPA: GNAT family N-acetyltransferase [Tepidisphaeraceae bacterium]|jgi:ribosomal protein S18 acetylase RimI-like enzyme
MNIQIKHDLTGINWNELANLYWEGMVAELLRIPRPQAEAWEKFAAENRLELENSDHVCLAYVEERCVGAVHALSDGVRDAAIFGLVVHPEFRRRGIATQLVQELLADLGPVSILVRPDAASAPIFRKFEFRALSDVMALRHESS